MLHNVMYTQKSFLTVHNTHRKHTHTCSNVMHYNEGQRSCYSVLLLTPQDGQQNIITTAQDMCRSVLQRKLKTNEIDTTMVNRRLSGMVGLPVYVYRGRERGGCGKKSCIDIFCWLLQCWVQPRPRNLML